MSQVKKNVAGLAALGVATAGLGLYAYFGVFRTDEAASAAKEVSEQLVPAAKDASGFDGFRKLVVTAKGETTTLEHDAKGWRITSPLAVAADDGVVESLLSAIKSDKLSERVDEHPSAEDLKKYGLDQPRFTVAVDYGNGKDSQSVTFSGGIVNSYDNSVYVMRKGSSAVYSAPGALGDAASKNTFDLRDKRIVTLGAEDLRQIELSGGISLVRDAQKHWQLVKPVSEPADEDTVTGLVSALTSARAIAFPSAAPGDAQTETAELTPATGEKIELSLSDSKDHHAYAVIKSGARSTVAEISESVFDALKKKPADFKDRTVLRFEEKQVAKVQFTPTGGGPALTVERQKLDSQDWTVTAPKKVAAKKWKLSTVLWTLNGLKAASFGPAHPSEKELAKVGLGAKSQSVALFDAKGARLGTLTLGNAVKDQKGQVWARGPSGAVYAIDGSRLTDLPQSLDDLLEMPSKTAAK
jgi:hypothetical protein